MTIEQNKGITKEEQSIKNFLRLYQSVVEQSGLSFESVIDTALTAIIRLMIADSGAEITSAYLRALADSLEAEMMDSDEVKH